MEGLTHKNKANEDKTALFKKNVNYQFKMVNINVKFFVLGIL